MRPLFAAGWNHANHEAVVLDDIAITVGLRLETGPQLPMRAGSSGGCRIVKRRYRTAADFLPFQPTPEIKGWAPTPVRSDVEFADSTSRNPASACDTVLRLRLTASRVARNRYHRQESIAPDAVRSLVSSTQHNININQIFVLFCPFGRRCFAKSKPKTIPRLDVTIVGSQQTTALNPG